MANGSSSYVSSGYGTVTYSGISNFQLNLSQFNDTIHTGSGNDSLQGQDGEDTLFAGAGDDSVNGDNDNDTLSGGRGNDDLDGGSGDDVIYGDDEPSPFDNTGAYTRDPAVSNFSQGTAIDLTSVFTILSSPDGEITDSGILPTASVTSMVPILPEFTGTGFSVGNSGGTVTVDIDHGSEDGVTNYFDTYLRVYDATAR